jgi:dGTPase
MKSKNISNQILVHELVRKLISILVQDIINTSKNNITKLNIQKVENVRSNKDRIVLFSNDIFMQLKIIREFLLNKMWRHPKVESSKKLGKKVISELFDLFFEKPKELFTFSLTLNKSSLISKNDKDLARLIVDKISGLTDRNALEIHKNYFNSNYTL